jgi:hypothetical protein
MLLNLNIDIVLSQQTKLIPVVGRFSSEARFEAKQFQIFVKEMNETFLPIAGSSRVSTFELPVFGTEQWPFKYSPYTS